MSSVTTSAAFFEAKYRGSADPWEFASSDYELGRYARIMASVEGRRFGCGLELGCSVGVLTEQLAGICERLDALDVSVTAVKRARERCLYLQNVDIRAGSVLTDVPPRNYDLIVFSEIGYYFERDVLAQITRALMARLSPGGLLLGAHWLGHSDDHILSGDEVHEVITGLTELEVTFSERHAKYRLEHWKIA
jgi:hypothetical protein